MNKILKILCGVACAFVFCFLAIGYAAVQDTLSVIGSVTIERAVTDICISHEHIDAYSLDPVTGELTIKETYTDSTDNENYRVIGILENGFVGYSEAASVISVSIPQSVQTIGDNAFTGCSNLKYFTVDQNNAYFMADNVLFSKVGTSLLRYPPGYKYPTPMLYHIPQDVASINRYAFCDLPAGTLVVTRTSGASPWGASSPCLILVAPEHYSTIQSFVGNSESGYTITGDSTVANTNLVFTNLQSNSRDNREWAAVDSEGKFTIPSSICNASSPSVLAVATVIGDINIDQLSADLGDDQKAVIGGGRWTFGLYDSLNTTGNDVDLIVNDGYFGGSGVNISKSHTVINGGVFSVAYFIADTASDGPSSAVINGGEWTYTGKMNFTSLDSSRISVEIKGGTFHWSGIVASSSQHVITGGTFKFDPTSTGYIPSTHTAINNGDGTWTVSDANAAVVNEEETLSCSCESKCTELYDACEVCKTDITNCKGTEAPDGEELACSCETKCTELTEACEVCKTDITNCGGTEAPAVEDPICSCETKCTELTEACEICKTDITNCKGTEAPAVEDPICSCETKCTELTEACEVCKTDITNCGGTEAPAVEDPICSCETKCTELNEACEVCMTDIVLCKGTEVSETTEPESPTGDSPSNGEQGEQPTEDAETTTPSDVSDGDVIETEETQTPDGQNASESEETSEPVISTDPVILPSEDEEDGEEQESSDDQQGQE